MNHSSFTQWKEFSSHCSTVIGTLLSLSGMKVKENIEACEGNSTNCGHRHTIKTTRLPEVYLLIFSG